MWAPVCSPPSMLLQTIRGGIGRSVLIIAQLAVYLLGCFICCLLSWLTCHRFQRDLGYSRRFSLPHLLWQLLVCFEWCNKEPVERMTLWLDSGPFTLSVYQDLTSKLCSALLVKKKKKQTTKPKNTPHPRLWVYLNIEIFNSIFWCGHFHLKKILSWNNFRNNAHCVQSRGKKE